MARATYTPNAPLLLTNIQYNLTTSQNESVCVINFMAKKQKMRDASFADPDEPKPPKRRRKANRGGRPRL